MFVVFIRYKYVNIFFTKIQMSVATIMPSISDKMFMFINTEKVNISNRSY